MLTPKWNIMQLPLSLRDLCRRGSGKNIEGGKRNRRTVKC